MIAIPRMISHRMRSRQPPSARSWNRAFRKLLNFASLINLGAATALIVKMASVGFAYFQNIVLAHCMSPSGFGEYAIGLSTAMALGIAVAAGQPTSILRFWPEYIAQERAALARGALLFGYCVTGFATIAFAAVSLLFFLLGNAGHFTFLAYAVPLTMTWALSEFVMSVLRVKGSVLGAILPRDVALRIAVISLGLACLLNAWKISSAAILLSSALILAVLVVIQIVYSSKLTHVRVSRILPQLNVSHWARTSLGIWLATTLMMVWGQVDTPLVGLLLTNIEAGQFFVIQRTAALITVALLATNTITAPIFAYLYHANRKDELQQVAARSSAGVAAFSLLICTIYFLFGRFILGMFGSEYGHLTFELNILSAGYLIDGLCGPVGVMLLLTGHQRVHITWFSTFLLVKILSQLFLVSHFGLFGSVVGASSAQALMPVFLCLSIRRTIGIDPSILGLLARGGYRGGKSIDSSPTRIRSERSA